MNGLSFSATTEKRKGILLDPRTKLILLLTITTLMFSTSNEGIMNIVKPCLSLVPFALILSERRFKTAGKYLVLYAVCFILERIALTSLSGLLSFIVLAVTSIMTRFAPGIMTGAYLISSTSISEFIGAMERMHITEKIVIPEAVLSDTELPVSHSDDKILSLSDFPDRYAPLIHTENTAIGFSCTCGSSKATAVRFFQDWPCTDQDNIPLPASLPAENIRQFPSLFVRILPTYYIMGHFFCLIKNVH